MSAARPVIRLSQKKAKVVMPNTTAVAPRLVLNSAAMSVKNAPKL